MTPESPENPFASERAWTVSEGGEILPAGEHLVEIEEVDGGNKSSGGHPQIEVRLSNNEGQIRDWIVVIPATIGRVAMFTDAAGLDRPSDAQVTAEGSGYRLDARYLDQLIGRKVGVVVRDEKDRNDPTRTRQRVAGYVPASSVAGKSDVPSDTSGFDQPKQLVADDIPF
jgi:hypothetical protein